MREAVVPDEVTTRDDISRDVGLSPLSSTVTIDAIRVEKKQGFDPKLIEEMQESGGGVSVGPVIERKQ